MKKIVMKIQPFTRDQKINVYEDGNAIDTLSIATENIVDGIRIMKDKYNDLNEVNIAGPKQYSRNIKDKINNNTQFTNVTVNLL